MRVSIGGKQFEVADEPADFWGWVNEGRYDREWAVLNKYLRPEHTFIDLGAWIGSHSLLASTIAHRTVAIEPDPVAYRILAENVKNTAIEALQVAIGDGSIVKLGSGLLGASTTRQNPNEGGGIGAWEPGQNFEVQSVTLRNLIDSLSITGPLFLKIDIEGGEEEILRDAAFFEQHKPFVYMELHPFWWKDPQTLPRLFKILSKCTFCPRRSDSEVIFS